MRSISTKQGLLAAYNTHEAKSSLSRLLKRVENGELIILCRDGQPVARLVPEPLPSESERKPGRAGRAIVVTTDFDRTRRIG